MATMRMASTKATSGIGIRRSQKSMPRFYPLVQVKAVLYCLVSMTNFCFAVPMVFVPDAIGFSTPH